MPLADHARITPKPLIVAYAVGCRFSGRTNPDRPEHRPSLDSDVGSARLRTGGNGVTPSVYRITRARPLFE
jgi:hypothetical protein